MAQEQQGFRADSYYCLVYDGVGYEQRVQFEQWLKSVDRTHIVLSPIGGDGRTGGFVYHYGADGGKQRFPVNFSYRFEGQSVVIWAQPTVSANMQQMNAGETDLVKGIEMTARTLLVGSRNMERFGTPVPVRDAVQTIVDRFYTFLGLRPRQAGLVGQAQLGL